MKAAGRLAVPAWRAARILLPLAKGREEECVWSLPIDRAGRTLGRPDEIALSVDSGEERAAFRTADAFRAAVIRRATYLWIAHNHPSGDLTPSDADIAATRKLVRAGRALDISVLGHIILSPDGRYASIRSHA